MPAGWVEESVHSRVPPPPQPWASDSPSPQPLKAHLPHLAPLSRKPKHGTEETGGERDRKKQREEERPPSVHRHFPADPERPLPSPPPSWHSWAEKDEGGGRESERGAVGPHTRLPTLGPRPPRPPLPAPGGLRMESQTPCGSERPFTQRGGTKGGRVNGDPPGSRDARQAGSGRAAAGVGDGCRQPDTTGWMRVPPSLCPSRAAPLRAVLRPGGRC